jgi:hypothetical protein
LYVVKTAILELENEKTSTFCAWSLRPLIQSLVVRSLFPAHKLADYKPSKRVSRPCFFLLSEFSCPGRFSLLVLSRDISSLQEDWVLSQSCSGPHSTCIWYHTFYDAATPDLQRDGLVRLLFMNDSKGIVWLTSDDTSQLISCWIPLRQFTYCWSCHQQSNLVQMCFLSLMGK